MIYFTLILKTYKFVKYSLQPKLIYNFFKIIIKNFLKNHKIKERNIFKILTYYICYIFIKKLIYKYFLLLKQKEIKCH